MTHDPEDRRPTTRLIGDAIRQATELLTTEVALVRLEASEKLTMAIASIASLVVAAVFIIVALIFLLQGLVELLVAKGFVAFEASFIVGGATGVLALIAIFVAARNLRPARLKPKRTMGQIQTAKDIVRGRPS